LAKLPRSIIKKYGISKKAWAVFRGSRTTKKKTRSKTKTRFYSMARRRKYKTHRKGAKSGFNMGGIMKILGGAAIAAVYEVFISPMIPLSATIKNVVEFVLGLLLATMRGMPTIVRAGGLALATINAFAFIAPMISGLGGGSSSPAVAAGVPNGYI